MGSLVKNQKLLVKLERSKVKLDVEYWHIYANNKRAGKVFIDLAKDKNLGEHPSIQIFINKSFQNKGIGSVAYKKACMASKHKTIYAHMRKSNVASQKAALKAGFKVVKSDEPQLTMVFRKAPPQPSPRGGNSNIFDACYYRLPSLLERGWGVRLIKK